MVPRIALFFALLLGLAAPSFAANIRLYLKDGDYQLVREYQVLEDRIRYYSVERSDWEEIPRELVDLDKTKKNEAEQQAVLEADIKAQTAEDAAVRASKKEARSVPPDPGPYYIHGDKIEPVKQAESEIVNDKGRNVLKILVPAPIVPGKSTVELKGETSSFQVAEAEPEFYFRLGRDERFGIVKLTHKKNARIVETVTIAPVTDEKTEERKSVDTFKKAEGDQLYKIWPQNPLEPGEYALVEFSDGELNLQVWDFSVPKK